MPRTQSSAEPASLLDAYHTKLLLAALGEGQKARDAFIQWRSALILDDIDSSAYRVLSQLVDTAQQHGIEERELPRLRGATKHTWLINQLRAQTLAAVLEVLGKHDIDTVLLKSGALFARYPDLISLRESADYDILVKRGDAKRAIILFLELGLQTKGLRVEKYTRNDFDTTHGAHFTGKNYSGMVDLHWRPLPSPDSTGYSDEIFSRAETAAFAGRQVKVPSLADQLFLTIARIEPWDIPEQFSRIVEAAHILRYSGGQLDWDLLVQLVHRHSIESIATAVFRILQNDLGIAVPPFVKWQPQKSLPRFFQKIEVKVSSIPPYKRTHSEREILKTLSIIRERPRLAACLKQPSLGADFTRALALSAWNALSGKQAIKRIWLDYAKTTHVFDTCDPDYLFGFSLPEDIGRWTDGKLAVFTVPVQAKAGTSINLKMSVIPAEPIDRNPVFHFRVCCNPGKVNSIALTRPHCFEPVEVIVPAEVIDAKSPRVLVVLELTDANAPILSDRGDDRRVLGLMFCGTEIIG